MFRRKKEDEDRGNGKKLPERRPSRSPFDDLFGDDFFMDFSHINRIMEELMKNAFSGGFKADKPMIYGFSMKTGPDGKPIINEFGNVKGGLEMGSANPSDEREPLVDVLNDEKEITVIVELPGVNKEDINAEAAEDNLIVSVDTESRKFYKEIKLPEKIKTDRIDANYNNGVLEIKLEKLKKSKPKKQINIK